MLIQTPKNKIVSYHERGFIPHHFDNIFMYTASHVFILYRRIETLHKLPPKAGQRRGVGQEAEIKARALLLSCHELLPNI